MWSESLNIYNPAQDIRNKLDAEELIKIKKLIEKLLLQKDKKNIIKKLKRLFA